MWNNLDPQLLGWWRSQLSKGLPERVDQLDPAPIDYPGSRTHLGQANRVGRFLIKVLPPGWPHRKRLTLGGKQREVRFLPTTAVARRYFEKEGPSSRWGARRPV